MFLDTDYLGLRLRNPLVASAGPISQTVSGVQSLADGGVGAVVLYSLFEEQLTQAAERDAFLEEAYADSFAEATSYFPARDTADAGVAASYLSLVERSAAAIEVPLIASLNGSSLGSWVHFARSLQDAGAAAIECNIYFVPGDLTLSGAEVEQRHLDILAAVKAAVDIPVAVKLSPHFSSVGNFSLRLVDAGADGLVLFNRFLQPDVTIGLSVSGALTPAGLGLSALSPLLRGGYVDWVISTGANCVHDTHFGLALALHQGNPNLDDRVLRQDGVVRIYDILFDYNVLLSTDAFYRELVATPPFQKIMGTAEFHYLGGKFLRERERVLGNEHPCLLSTAYECGVPVYNNSPGDSSNDLIVPALPRTVNRLP